ncbi:MAG: hypothetical protein OXH99_18385 [Bryobacterales bacterium]|nr:hypothetical protein [Bryobacterales bacterium]
MRALASTVVAHRHRGHFERRWNRPSRRALGIALLSAILATCGPPSETLVDSVEPIEDDDEDPISFLGTWTREFDVGPGNTHIATYVVASDRIHYTLTGDVGNADYIMIRHAFSGTDNRFVGHSKDGEYYVLFARDISDRNVTIYKQKVDGLTAALELAMPPNDTTENHGWNSYEKSQDASAPE